MCTLIVLHRCLEGRPLLVAANRDEFFARPAEGPAVRERETGAVLMPLDLEAGGTWLGLNAEGVFVGLTNLRPRVGKAEEKPSLIGVRSRGEVVLAALDARTAKEATRIAAGLEEDAYNPFQLLIADRDEASLTIYRCRPEIKALPPGIHVVGNIEGSPEGSTQKSENIPVDFGATDSVPEQSRPVQARARKLTRIRERVEKLMAESGRDPLEGLAEICREHVDEGIGSLGTDWFGESTCVHLADRYGTRSSFLLELADAPRTSRLWTTDGPPCAQPFEDMSALLDELDQRSSASVRA